MHTRSNHVNMYTCMSGHHLYIDRVHKENSNNNYVGCRPVLLLITVLINRVEIMPRVQIMGIHTRASVTMDGLEQNVNLKIFV
jgi:hypothetical protein